MKKIYSLLFFTFLSVVTLKAEMPTNGLRSSLPNIVASFPFDGTLYNTGGTQQFSGGSPVQYVTDRRGGTEKALQIRDRLRTVSVPTLPGGNASRTVSLWFKIDNFNGEQYATLFYYGADANNERFGAYVEKHASAGAISKIWFNSFGTDKSVTLATPLTLGSWQHLVITLQSGQMKMYLNNNLIATEAVSLNTTTKILNIGVNNVYGAIDDLTIYDSALTDTEINDLFSAVPPVIGDVSHDVTVAQTTVNYEITSGEEITSAILRYGTSADALTSVKTLSPGNPPISSSTNLIGLTPNTIYYYQIVVAGAYSSVSSPVYSFNSSPANIIAKFPFNGSLYNTDETLQFSGITTEYTTDKNSVANKALQIRSSSRNVTISNLPDGSADRAVSLWFKIDNFNSIQYANLFYYGNDANNERFGAYVEKSASGVAKIWFNSFGTDKSANVSLALGSWNHLVINLASGVMKMYLNNNLIATETVTLNTTNKVLRIGEVNNVYGAIDDLTIYDRALTAAEINDVYNGNSLPEITNIHHSITSGQATVSYQISDGGNITSAIIKYGTSAAALNTNAALNTGNVPINGSIVLSGLAANTKYYYQIEATNAAGTTSSPVYSFNTSGLNLIASFPFDGSLYNTEGNLQFNGAGQFGSDRNNSSDKAVNMFGGERNVTIPDLPVGNADRAVSLWFNITNYNNQKYSTLFYYGSDAANQRFGAYVEKNATSNVGSKIWFNSHTTDIGVNVNLNRDTWHHLVVNLEAGVMKMYLDNTLIATETMSLNTGSTIFKIGTTNTSGLIDDLNIYDRALTTAEIANLFTYNVTTLPVNLVSFTAKAQHNAAVLNWQTASETNNSHFVVKHSTNGVDFITLGNIAAKAENSASYQYSHNKPANGTNYYQLLQVDKDGKTTDLGVKAVTFNLGSYTVSLYPNPTTNQANLSFAQGAFHSAKLVNVNGQVLQTASIGKTQQTVTFSLGSYPNGVYFIRLQGNSQNSVQKIIKQ